MPFSRGSDNDKPVYDTNRCVECPEITMTTNSEVVEAILQMPIGKCYLVFKDLYVKITTSLLRWFFGLCRILNMIFVEKLERLKETRQGLRGSYEEYYR